MKRSAKKFVFNTVLFPGFEVADKVLFGTPRPLEEEDKVGTATYCADWMDFELWKPNHSKTPVMWVVSPDGESIEGLETAPELQAELNAAWMCN